MPNGSGHEYDVFVSYAHADNEKPLGSAAQYGWVTTLAHNLNTGPGHLRKNLFIDHQLKPGDVFSDDLVAKVGNSSLLLLLLSQNYIDSKWCGKELDHFIRTHANDPDKPADVFVVEHFPFDTFDKVPPNIHNLRKRLIHAQFWHQPADTSAPVLAGNPTPKESGPENERHYWQKLHELRDAIDSRHRGPVHYREVNQYIEASLTRVKQVKAEQERLEREAKEAETKRLELEAQVQRETAERAEAELVRAEKEKRQAQEYAETSRRKTHVALVGVAVAVVCFLIAAGAGWLAKQEKTRAEGLARDAIAGEFTAKAENLTNQYPDHSALLALTAWRISPIAKAQALIRAALADYSTQRVLRGHEDPVRSAQFAPDGKWW